MIAVADRGSMLDASLVFYMDKIVTGLEGAGVVDLRQSLEENIRRQGADDADTLLLAAGHLARVAVEELMRIHRHHIHQLFGAAKPAPKR